MQKTMPLKIHLFPASHVCLHKTLSRRRDARAGGPQGIFLCRNIHLTDFRRGGKACGDLLSGSRGERDEEHDKELTERLECQESLLRTFLGKERCGDARQASTIEGNNSFWISHNIYHGSRPIVPTPMPVYRRRGKFVRLWLSDVAPSSRVHQLSKDSVFLRLDSSLLTKRTNTRHTETVPGPNTPRH